jgi:hypothetical protein
MQGLAECSRIDSRRASRLGRSASGSPPHSPARLASTRLMPLGSALAIPRLDGIVVAHQLSHGEQTAARIAKTVIEAGVADPDHWTKADRNPLRFLKISVDAWLQKQGVAEIPNQFFVDMTITTSLDRFLTPNESVANDASQAFLTLEPDSAGYVILGPTLWLLEAAHPRLPATFVQLFFGALNRWVRVYDYRDALARVESLREYYESDPEAGEFELPDVERCIPASMKQSPLSSAALRNVQVRIQDPLARELMELVVKLDRLSKRSERPKIGDDTRELLVDCGEPVPALLAVFEGNDAIEGCFDEDCQGMLELIPEPNLIVPFNGESQRSVTSAFGALSTVCNVLSCASRLMRMMPGNERPEVIRQEEL